LVGVVVVVVVLLLLLLLLVILLPLQSAAEKWPFNNQHPQL
jgi:hypothetical protein